MKWTFLVTAESRPRMQSRIFQILDHHMIQVHSFASLESGDELRLSFAVLAEKDQAKRIEELVRKLEGIHAVEVFAMNAGLTRTIGLFKILCDQVSRLQILQIVAALDVKILTVQPLWIVLESIGTSREIESLERILCPYGRVQSLSAAAVGVHGFEVDAGEDLLPRRMREQPCLQNVR